MRLKLFHNGVTVYVEIPDMPFRSRKVPRLALREAVKEHGQWIVFVDQHRRFRRRISERWVIGDKSDELWGTLNIYQEPDDIPF